MATSASVAGLFCHVTRGKQTMARVADKSEEADVLRELVRDRIS